MMTMMIIMIIKNKPKTMRASSALIQENGRLENFLTFP